MRRILRLFTRVNGLTLWDRLRLRFNPHLITTTYDDGATTVLKDRRTLTPKSGTIDTDAEHTTWVEYWDGSQLVHRSVNVRLKRWPQFAETQLGGLQ